MKKFLAATAIVAMTFSITTPAWADDEDENYDDVVLSPVTLEGDYTPQQICDEALKPNPHSGFTTEPLVSTDTGWLNDGSPVRDENVGNAIPTGTPTSSFLILDGGYFRNGGSPNVWGHGTATLNYPNSTQEYTTVQNLVRTQTVSCHVYKWVGQNSPKGPHMVEPAGLQTTGNVAVDHDQTAGPNGFDYNAGPVTITGQEVYALICISPGKKGGSWTGKNGFAANKCQAASTAAGGYIPSGNVPQI